MYRSVNTSNGIEYCTSFYIFITGDAITAGDTVAAQGQSTEVAASDTVITAAEGQSTEAATDRNTVAPADGTTGAAAADGTTGAAAAETQPAATGGGGVQTTQADSTGSGGGATGTLNYKSFSPSTSFLKLYMTNF